MRDRELGPPHTDGRPYGRAKRVTSNNRRHNHHARVCRDVARYRLGWPKQAHLVRTAIRESSLCSEKRKLMESVGRPGYVCAWRYDGAEKVWRRAGGGREGRVCPVGHACSTG